MNLHLLLLSSLVTSVACGPFEQMDGSCKVNEFIEVEYQGKVDCNKVKANFAMAVKIAGARGLLTPERFNFLLMDMPIYLYDSWEIKQGERSLSGLFDVRSGIHLAAHGQSLLHEVFHAHEANLFILTTAKHKDWDGKGYNAASDEFFAKIERIRAKTYTQSNPYGVTDD